MGILRLGHYIGRTDAERVPRHLEGFLWMVPEFQEKWLEAESHVHRPLAEIESVSGWVYVPPSSIIWGLSCGSAKENYGC